MIVKHGSSERGLRAGLVPAPFVFIVAFLLASPFEVNAQKRNIASRVPAVPPVSLSPSTPNPTRVFGWMKSDGTNDRRANLKSRESPQVVTRYCESRRFQRTLTGCSGKRNLTLKLLPTTDQAELLFQQAETAREQAKDDASRRKAEISITGTKNSPCRFLPRTSARAACCSSHGVSKGLSESMRRGAAVRFTLKPRRWKGASIAKPLHREAITSFAARLGSEGFQPEAQGFALCLNREVCMPERAEYRKAIDSFQIRHR